MSEQADYTKMAQGMLQMWQDHWKNISEAMTQTASAAASAATETKAEPPRATQQKPESEQTFTNSVTEGMEQWQRFMASWAQTSPTQPSQPQAAPAATTAPDMAAQPEEPVHADVRPEPELQQQRPPQHEPEPVFRETSFAATAGAAPDTRDVLFAELSRRVEFLHERCVRLETELEKLKRRI